MKQLCLMAVCVATFLVPAVAAKGETPFAGRWDITVTTPNATYPSWLELIDKNGTLEVRYQPRAGSVRALTGAKLEGANLTLTISPATDSNPAITWVLSVRNNQLQEI